MRTLRLKEKDANVFLRLENTDTGALLVVEQDGCSVAHVLLNIKQLANAQDWIQGQRNDIINRNKVTSEKYK